MTTTPNTVTAASIRVNGESVVVPRETGWYEPTENVERSLRHEFEFSVGVEDVTDVIENGEIARVDQRPAPGRLSYGRPELTYRGETQNGDLIEVDVSPAGHLTGPFGGPGSAVCDGICQMRILRIREAFKTFVDPISQEE